MFIKRSFHNFQGTFSCFVSRRMVHEADAAEEVPRSSEGTGEEEEAAPDKAEKAEKIEVAKRDAQEKRAEHLNTIEAKRSALEKVATIIKESPESIEKAFYNYNLSEHDQPNRLEQAESARIIQKIIDAKREHKLDGITFIYLGGTNGQRHDLNKLEKRMAAEQKEWHKKKSEAFANILKGKNTIQPVELQTFILANEELIKEYQAKVADNKPNKLKIFLGTNDAAFCDAAGLFDLALAYQRADDLYGAINEGRKIDPLKDIITLDLKTGAGSEDLENCRSKLEFTMPEGGRGELVPGPTPPERGVVPKPTPSKPGPNDLPPETPPGAKGELTPGPAPLRGELVPGPITSEKHLEAKHFADKDAELVSYKGQLDKAKEILSSLDIETKKILTHLTPPVFSLTNSLQPKADSNGYYFVYIDIRNTPEEIKKNLEKAAKMIVEEPRFLINTPQEKDALIEAQKKGLPFKNIRQAYVEDMKRSPKIDWNKSNVSPIAPNEWIEKEQDTWLNYDAETPAEKNERAQKVQEKRESAEEDMRKEKERAIEENKKKETERAEEIKNKEAEPADLESLKNLLEAFNAKRAAFNTANGTKLVSRFDTFDTSKGPYLEADIDEYKEAVGNLSSGIDRFGAIFESMSPNTKNILKSVELMIDQEDSERGKSEKNISRNADGSYQLWFDISKDEKAVKKDLIDQKNKFVKGKKYTEDSPIEAAQRASVGDTFRNFRQAYQERGEGKKRCITYNAKNESWEPAKGRKWMNENDAFVYDYSTEPMVPTPGPTPPPEPEPAPPKPEPKPKPAPKPTPPPEPTAPETPESLYKPAASDFMKINGAGIVAQQKIEGSNKRRIFTFNPPIALTADEGRVTTDGGRKYMALVLKEGEKSVGSIYLDENGKMNVHQNGVGYEIVVNGREIAITKKVRRH